MKILINENRTKCKMSLRELSEKTGISKSALSNYENEKTLISLGDMELIAKALHVKISDLFESDYK